MFDYTGISCSVFTGWIEMIPGAEKLNLTSNFRFIHTGWNRWDQPMPPEIP
jgi:hypothetical protein